MPAPAELPLTKLLTEKQNVVGTSDNNTSSYLIKKFIFNTQKDLQKNISFIFVTNLFIMIVICNVVLLSIFQPEHMLVIFLAVVLLFGGKKIPELMKGIGKGMREFKDAKENVKSEIEEGMKEKDKEQEIRELKAQLEQKRVQDALPQNLEK